MSDQDQDKEQPGAATGPRDPAEGEGSGDGPQAGDDGPVVVPAPDGLHAVHVTMPADPDGTVREYMVFQYTGSLGLELTFGMLDQIKTLLGSVLGGSGPAAALDTPAAASSVAGNVKMVQDLLSTTQVREGTAWRDVKKKAVFDEAFRGKAGTRAMLALVKVVVVENLDLPFILSQLGGAFSAALKSQPESTGESPTPPSSSESG